MTASEAYDDCLQFFEDTIQPAMINSTGGFQGQLIPEEDFRIKLTITHGALTAFVKRYPVANFTFHSERNLIPGASETDKHYNPLSVLYTEITIDFTPYGTVFGGSSDDNGGGMTRSSVNENSVDDEPLNEITVDGPSPGPETPTGPSTNMDSTPSPAIA